MYELPHQEYVMIIVQKWYVHEDFCYENLHT
jgi:hypothetical protein